MNKLKQDHDAIAKDLRRAGEHLGRAVDKMAANDGANTPGLTEVGAAVALLIKATSLLGERVAAMEVRQG